MAFSKLKVSFPVLIFILISVILSIMTINGYQIEVNNNNGTCDCGSKNNTCGCRYKQDSGRPFFLIEGMKNKKNNKNNKIEGMNQKK
tara:strand:- start:5027 stop:5287 length:261 start_codon:yes stop_codon:yes gene_type:complete